MHAWCAQSFECTEVQYTDLLGRSAEVACLDCIPLPQLACFFPVMRRRRRLAVMSGPSETGFTPIGFDVERLYQGDIAAAGATETLTGRPTLFQQQTMPNV